VHLPLCQFAQKPLLFPRLLHRCIKNCCEGWHWKKKTRIFRDSQEILTKLLKQRAEHISTTDVETMFEKREKKSVEKNNEIINFTKLQEDAQSKFHAVKVSSSSVLLQIRVDALRVETRVGLIHVDHSWIEKMDERFFQFVLELVTKVVIIAHRMIARFVVCLENIQKARVVRKLPHVLRVHSNHLLHNSLRVYNNRRQVRCGRDADAEWSLILRMVIIALAELTDQFVKVLRQRDWRDGIHGKRSLHPHELAELTQQHRGGRHGKRQGRLRLRRRGRVIALAELADQFAESVK